MPAYIKTQPAQQTMHSQMRSQGNVQVNNFIALMIISFPLLLLIVVKSYKKYQNLAHQRRINILEKSWLLSIKNNAI